MVEQLLMISDKEDEDSGSAPKRERAQVEVTQLEKQNERLRDALVKYESLICYFGYRYLGFAMLPAHGKLISQKHSSHWNANYTVLQKLKVTAAFY